MQTFVPHGSDFYRNAIVLDRQRLGKQRVEAWQIILTLTEGRKGWSNHPAVKMWDGHIETLAWYGMHMCREWMRRGYKDTLYDRFVAYSHFATETYPQDNTYPAWLDRADVQLSHRSNLIRKMPQHYQMFWPDVPDDLPYVWPSSTQKV